MKFSATKEGGKSKSGRVGGLGKAQKQGEVDMNRYPDPQIRLMDKFGEFFSLEC